jgi:ubiquinone/menaquinone biosynthesis C-methylase UbiE
MLGRNGGLMNDVRGHTTVQHLFDEYPDLDPKRIVDLGCAVGASTVAVASYFPDAQVYGVDVGGAMLRYAHARAEHLGQRVHYVQANAEQTAFPDESFDFVYSCVLLHETSKAATRRIFAECHRLLGPGDRRLRVALQQRAVLARRADSRPDRAHARGGIRRREARFPGGDRIGPAQDGHGLLREERRGVPFVADDLGTQVT